MDKYTAIVIGSGPAGHTCAIRMVKIACTIKDSRRYRINVSGYSINFGQVASRRDEVIHKTARVSLA